MLEKNDNQGKTNYYFEIILKGIDLITSQTFSEVEIFPITLKEINDLIHPNKKIDEVIEAFGIPILQNKVLQPTGFIAKDEYFVSDKETLFMGLICMDDDITDIPSEPTQSEETTYHKWSKENKLLNEKMKHSKWIAHKDSRRITNGERDKLIKDQKRSYFLFKKEFELSRIGLKSAELYILVDNSCIVFLNGRNLRDDLITDIYGYEDMNHLSVIDYIKQGKNELYFLVENIHSNTYDHGLNIYGLRFCLDIEFSSTEISKETHLI